MPVNDGFPGKGLYMAGDTRDQKNACRKQQFWIYKEEGKEDIENESLRGTVVRKTAWWQWGPTGVTARGYQLPACEEEL